MVNISQETERKLKRTDIIQVEPNRDKKKYKKIASIGRRMNEPSYQIVQEILSMLPTKAVVRFSCVSKQWFRAVSDAYFRDLHYSRMGPDPKPKILLLRYSKKEEDNVINMYLPSYGRVWIRLESDIPLYRLSTRQNYEFCNACNGLLCFVSGNNPEEPIIVCNPLTKEHLTLPRAPPLKKSDCFVALGFCPRRRRYKIFRLSFPLGDVGSWSTKKGLLEVCDVVGSSRPWRTISPYLNMTPSGRPLYLDGKIYWMAIDEPFWKCGPSQSVIVSVDVQSEKYKYISIPHTGVAFHQYRETSILELKGRLFVAALYYGGERIYFWALNDFGRGHWDLQYTCKHLSFPLRDILLPAGAGEIIDLFSYDNIIYIKLHYICRWICYDTTDSKSEFPLIPKIPGIPRHEDLLRGFFPSLLSPKQFTS